MKISVIGAGAIGSVVGGLLSKAGEDVTLIGRKAHVDAINQSGLILDGKSGQTVVRVNAAEKLDHKPDLALLTVKTQDVESSVREVKPFLSETTIVTMQNGVRSDDLLAGILGKEDIVSSVVIFSSLFLEQGKVTYSVPFGGIALLIGEPFGANGDRVGSLLALFNKALPTSVNDDIRGAHWTKLLWNLNTAVPAITGRPFQELTQYPQIGPLNTSLMREGWEVANKAAIKKSEVPGMPLSLMETIVNTPPSVSPGLSKVAFGKVPVLGSIFQSLTRGNSTEISYLNGEIVSLGKKVGVPTPANSLIVDLVHEVEVTRKFLTVDELVERLRSQHLIP